MQPLGLGSSDFAQPALPCTPLAAAQPAGRPASPATQPTPPALDDDLLQQLCCPITHEPMSDPMVATFGHTYERAAIEGGSLKRGWSRGVALLPRPACYLTAPAACLDSQALA